MNTNTTDITTNINTISLESTIAAVSAAGIRVWQQQGKTRIYCPKQGGYLIFRRVSATDKTGTPVSYMDPKVADGKVSGGFAATVRQICEKLANI